MNAKKELLFDVEERAARAQAERELENENEQLREINTQLKSKWKRIGFVETALDLTRIEGLFETKKQIVGFVEYQIGGATVRVLNTQEALTRFRRNLKKMRAAYIATA